MDGRWKQLLAGGLFAGVLGCSSTPKQPSYPGSPPQVVHKNSTVVSEPPDDRTKKDGPVAIQTLIVFADTWIDAINRDPNKPMALREQLLKQAREHYMEVLRRDPKNVDALIGLGKMYHFTGETEQLQEIEQRLRTQHPNNAKVWAWIAVRQGQSRQWDAAAESYYKAAKLDPDNRTYRMHLGFTLARANRYEEGYAWMSKSMREPDARYSLAQMMLHTGQVDLARQQLALALDFDPEFKAAADQLATLGVDAAPRPFLPDVNNMPIKTVEYQEPAARPKASTSEPVPISR